MATLLVTTPSPGSTCCQNILKQKIHTGFNHLGLLSGLWELVHWTLDLALITIFLSLLFCFGYPTSGRLSWLEAPSQVFRGGMSLYWHRNMLFLHSPGGATDLGTEASGLLSDGPVLYELRHQEVKDRTTEMFRRHSVAPCLVSTVYYNEICVHAWRSAV